MSKYFIVTILYFFTESRLKDLYFRKKNKRRKEAFSRLVDYGHGRRCRFDFSNIAELQTTSLQFSSDSDSPNSRST
jgi:hypothetical protein